MIIQHQENVAGFAGAHTYWFLPNQLIRGAVAVAVSLTWTSVGKLFLFTSDQWASTVELKLESSFRATSGNVGVRLFDVTAAAAVAASEITKTSTSLARHRTASLAMIDGHEYRMQVGVGSGAAGAIVGASIIGLTPP